MKEKDTLNSFDGVFTGAIPRVEASDPHRAFVRAVKPTAILVPITEARSLVNDGETAASFYGTETLPITTTTIRDEYLRWISLKDEYRIVREFGSVGHIPTDRSVYENQSSTEQLTRINRYLGGVIWLSDKFEAETTDGSNDNGTGADVEFSGEHSQTTPAFVPLVKGLQPPERKVAYHVFNDVEAQQYSFYGAQYFSGGAGPMELVNDIREVAAETEQPLFVIGLFSPTYLHRLPEDVVAASGLNQWLSTVKPEQNADNPKEMRHRWSVFADKVTTALE